MDKTKQAVDRYKGEYNCAQAILTTFAYELGLEEDIAENLTSAFGAGINYRGEMCGAVSASLLSIGLKLKALNEFDELKKELVKEYSDKFIQQFIIRNKAVTCNKILAIDISNPKNLERARETKLFDRVCPGIVQSSAEILKDIFLSINKQIKLIFK